MTIVSSINIFARDLDGLIDFYIRLFGFNEELDRAAAAQRQQQQQAEGASL